MDTPGGSQRERFPPNARTARLEAGVTTLFVVAGLAAGPWLDFSVWNYAFVLGVILVIALGGWLQVRDTTRNWVSFGVDQTILSAEGVVTTVQNDEVTRVWWTRCNARGASSKNLAFLELRVGNRDHEVELYLTSRQRRQALQNAIEAFPGASWTYDAGVGFLVPDATWGPGEPVPGLRIRDLWRNRSRDPLDRDPLANIHRHRARRRLLRR